MSVTGSISKANTHDGTDNTEEGQTSFVFEIHENLSRNPSEESFEEIEESNGFSDLIGEEDESSFKEESIHSTDSSLQISIWADFQDYRIEKEARERGSSESNSGYSATTSFEFIDAVKSRVDERRNLTPIFLDLMCRKNRDKSKNLILRGGLLMKNLKRRLIDCDLIDLADYLKVNSKVASVDLSYNSITSLGLESYFIPLLKSNASLKEVILTGNEIGLEGLEALSAVSSELKLTVLRLNGNKLGSKSGPALVELLRGCKSLKHLDISETDQSVRSLACVTAILRDDYVPPGVTRYPFVRNPTENDEKQATETKKTASSTSKLVKCLREMLKKQIKFSESNISISTSEKEKLYFPSSINWTEPISKIAWRINNEKLKNASRNGSKTKLKDKSKSNVELKAESKSVVSLDNRGKWGASLPLKKVKPVLSTETVNEVCKETNETPTLEALFMNRILGQSMYQPLTNHFARLISYTLKSNNSLRELHIEKNSLTDSDIEVLCEGLKYNKTLKLLNVSANHIGCLGLSHFAECLQHHKLEALVMNHNDVSDYGARCLFFNLPSTNLKMLDIGYNAISDAGLMDILYSMRKNPKMLVLYIWGNPFTKKSLKKIKEYLIQGWILTDSLDIKIFEVDGKLQWGHRWEANLYKLSYYQRPRLQTPLVRPPAGYGSALNFEHYKPVYPRNMVDYVPNKSIYSAFANNTCTK